MQEKPAERSKQLSVTVSQLRVSLAEGAHQLSQVLHVAMSRSWIDCFQSPRQRARLNP